MHFFISYRFTSWVQNLKGSHEAGHIADYPGASLFERRIYPMALRNHQRIAMAAITIKTQAIGTL
jgi:hypothetical protein